MISCTERKSSRVSAVRQTVRSSWSKSSDARSPSQTFKFYFHRDRVHENYLQYSHPFR